MAKIAAGIIGGAGYTGGEMARILINHPDVSISFVHSKSNAGKFLYEVHSDLMGETEIKFTDTFSDTIDVLFLCLGHGESRKFLEEHSIYFKAVNIIDLSQDYRLHSGGTQNLFNGQPFLYGLPELNREQIRAARYIANPGCFATAIQLGLLPLAKAGLIGEVYTTGITGSTGAGQSLSASSHFSWRTNNIQPYKSLTHQHMKEVNQSLQQLQPSLTGSSSSEGSAVHFIPWRGDFARGIFISSQLTCSLPLEELIALYENFYRGHPFTFLSRQPIHLKQVVNNNKCLIHLEKSGNRLVVHSAIDNLLKGASGQAVQNMNLLFGKDEASGLHLKANAF